MKPANDPSVDYRKLVRDGYDRCSEAFSEARRREPGTELAPLLERLTPGSRVLDVGCGAGLPIAGALVRAGQRVTGVDVSTEQIKRARENVPLGEFLVADAMAVDFDPGSLDAAVSFYAIFHLPREEHEELFRRIARWLAPGGHLLASVAWFREDPYTEDFFGVRMYWSNWSREDYAAMLVRSGFALLESGTLGHGYDPSEERRPESHPVLFAQKRGA